MTGLESKRTPIMDLINAVRALADDDSVTAQVLVMVLDVTTGDAQALIMAHDAGVRQ